MKFELVTVPNYGNANINSFEEMKFAHNFFRTHEI
jgi:hypothetical protein